MRIVLAVAFVVAFALSVALLTAATFERNAERLMDTGGNPASMHARLAFASRIDPANVGVLELLVRIEADQSRRGKMIREVVSLEPYQVNGWLMLLRHKLALHEIDSELVEVFHQIERLAPYEPHVQETVLSEGLRHWLEIGPEARRAVVDTAVRALESSAPHRQIERRTLVTNGGLLPLVCAIASELSYCQNSGA